MEKPESMFHKRLEIEIPAEAELYEKLKAYQWNASTEIDWSRPICNFSEESYQRMAGSISREDFDRICAERRAFTFTQLFSWRWWNSPTSRWR